MIAKYVKHFLNEEVTQKDLDRISGLFARSKGDDEKLLQLTQNMANSITDYNKAIGRAQAAEQTLGEENNPIADIFYKRAEEIGGENTPISNSRIERTVRTKFDPASLPENPTYDEKRVPAKKWDASKKYIGYIYLPTYSAIALWDWEITGQLSDSAWENANPEHHWLFWSDLLPKLGRPEVKSNYDAVKNSYNLTSLLQYVGDRMIKYGRFGKAVGNKVLDMGGEVRSNVEDFPEEGPFDLAEYKENLIKRQDWKAKDYYWKGLTQEDVDAYYATDYTEKDLREDLKYIKQAMKSARAVGTYGYGKRGYGYR